MKSGTHGFQCLKNGCQCCVQDDKEHKERCVGAAMRLAVYQYMRRAPLVSLHFCYFICRVHSKAVMHAECRICASNAKGARIVETLDHGIHCEDRKVLRLDWSARFGFIILIAFWTGGCLSCMKPWSILSFMWPFSPGSGREDSPEQCCRMASRNCGKTLTLRSL